MRPCSSLVCLFLLLLSLSARAQYTIDGKVVNTLRRPVPAAAVILYTTKDSTVVKIEATDDNGAFRFISQPAGAYFIKVMDIKYRAVYLPLTVNRQTTLPEIILTEEHELAAIAVSARKPLIERKVDRTVFNVENSPSAVGSDAYEMLAKAPGVRTGNDEISLAGKGSVSVMVDDRLVNLSDDQLEAMLRSMPGSNVSKIEIITTPPAKYDAAGNAGIINIVTKKMKRNGLNGSVTLSYTQKVRASQSINTAFNYRNGKLNVFGNGNTNWLRFTSPQQITTYYPAIRMDQHLNQFNNPIYNRYEIGADYTINKRSLLGVQYTLGNTWRTMDQLYATSIYAMPEDIKDSTMRTNAYTTETALRNVANINYEWKIDSAGKKLNIDVDWFSRTNNRLRDFTAQTFFDDGVPVRDADYNKTNGNQMLDIRSAKMDITWPSHIADLTWGGKLSAIHNTSDNTFTYLSNGQYITDITKTNFFDYSEKTQALYASAQKKFGNWEMQAGLRGEYTQTKGISITLNQINTNDYFKLFPTAYAQYSFNDDNILNINYSRRIERPEFTMLDPFRQYSTGNSYEGGNPFLQPSFVHNVELAYTLKQSYTITLFYSQTQDDFEYILFVDSASNSHHLAPINAGNQLSYGFVASADINPLSWWESSVQLYGYGDRFSNGIAGDASYNIYAWALEGHNDFMLNKAKTLSADLGFNYNSTQLDNVVRQFGSFNMWGGVKAQLLKKQLVVAANMNDPFRTAIYRGRNLLNNSYREGYYDHRYVGLSLTWKFGNRNVKDRTQHDTEETRRAQ